MNELTLKPVRSYLAAGMLALGAVAVAFPVQPVWAQNRTLPDFTDLVEQVGPSVVNIRTSEKSRSVPPAASMSRCWSSSAALVSCAAWYPAFTTPRASAAA